ncbi:MAG TPA: hypothetical protein VMZ53_10295, partial [Kofleriaceae bacterium]|nr:hypothetical protein [Kofleriaceae bacterium]
GRIVQAAEKLAAEVGDPVVVAFARSARGICELQWGDFTAAIESCDKAIAAFREHGAGVVWEERTADVFGIWGLAWRGDWGEVARRCDALARAGEATGDRYAIMHAAIGVAVCGPLALDRPQLARDRIAKVMTGWPRDSYDLIQVRELVGITTVDLYEGNGAAALKLINEHWPRLEKSRMLSLEPLFGTLVDLRVRAALVAGEWSEAKSWAKKLERIPWGAGVAAATRAALAQHNGDRSTAARELEHAETLARERGIELHSAAIAERRSRVLEGNDAILARDRAASITKAKEIQNPERTFRALVPWPT